MAVVFGGVPSKEGKSRFAESLSQRGKNDKRMAIPTRHASEHRGLCKVGAPNKWACRCFLVWLETLQKGKLKAPILDSPTQHKKETPGETAASHQKNPAVEESQPNRSSLHPAKCARPPRGRHCRSATSSGNSGESQPAPNIKLYRHASGTDSFRLSARVPHPPPGRQLAERAKGRKGERAKGRKGERAKERKSKRKKERKKTTWKKERQPRQFASL